MPKKEDMMPQDVQLPEDEQVQEETPQTPLMLTVEQMFDMVGAAVAAAIEKQGGSAGKQNGRQKITKRVPAEQKKVKVKLFRDNGKYADDVVVSLNGMRYLVPRGVEAEVPEGVAEILENSQRQDDATDGMVRTLAQEWDEKAKKL